MCSITRLSLGTTITTSPLLQRLDELAMTDPKAVWREFNMAMRAVQGQRVIKILSTSPENIWIRDT